MRGSGARGGGSARLDEEASDQASGSEPYETNVTYEYETPMTNPTRTVTDYEATRSYEHYRMSISADSHVRQPYM